MSNSSKYKNIAAIHGIILGWPTFEVGCISPAAAAMRTFIVALLDDAIIAVKAPAKFQIAVRHVHWQSKIQVTKTAKCLHLDGKPYRTPTSKKIHIKEGRWNIKELFHFAFHSPSNLQKLGKQTRVFNNKPTFPHIVKPQGL